MCVSVNLMGLLKWRDNPKGLETYLRLFVKVDGEEIVKVKESSSLSLQWRCFSRMILSVKLQWRCFSRTILSVKLQWRCFS